MHRFIRITGLLTAVGGIGAASTVSADVWSFGGTRVAGMGGAGLALPFDVVDNNVLNPAMLGYGPRRFGLAEPSLDYNLDGLSISKVGSDFSGIGNGGVSAGKIASLAQEFGQRERDVSFDATLGIYAYGFALNGIGQAQVSTRPNGLLENFSQNPTENVDSASGSQLDAYGVGYYGYSLSYGHKLPIKNSASNISVGGSIDVIRAYYSHQVGSFTGVDENGNLEGSTSPGPEMNGANDVSKSGVGLDVGVLGDNGATGQGKTAMPFYYGLVVRNLISPNIKFQEAQVQAGGNQTGGSDGENTNNTLEPFKTRVDGGIGTQLNNKVLLAADWDDIGNRTSFSQIGFGGEYKVYGNSAIRAGYNTLGGLTLGASVFGFNLAVSARRTLVVGTEVRF